jgi:RNA polymerase nonessential primary-like sigma factor
MIDVSTHIGLAHLACKPFRSHVGRGFCYEDLVQAACEGLIYAANSYDPAQGKFSTYAVPMAKKFVKRLVATQTRTVKCPEYTQDRVAAAGKAKRAEPLAPRERRTTGGPFDWDSAPPARVPAGLKVTRADYAGVPQSWGVAQPDPWDVPRFANGERQDGEPEPDMVHSPRAELSFDFTREESDGESTMHDYLGEEDDVDPESLAAARELAGDNPRLQAALSGLNEKQRAVITGRLEGLMGPEIARRLGLSKERVRQIQDEAILLLKAALA